MFKINKNQLFELLQPELQQCVMTMSKCLNALSCCQVTECRFTLISRWTGMPNEVADIWILYPVPLNFVIKV